MNHLLQRLLDQAAQLRQSHPLHDLMQGMQSAFPTLQPTVVSHGTDDHADGQFIGGSFQQSEQRLDGRDYKLYLPPNPKHLPQPLVVMLHGCGQNPDDFAVGTGMNAFARDQGLIVLYPAQSLAANPQGCWNWFKHSHQQRGRGEPALLAAMVRDVMARYPVDASRVYVAGLSAGGAMAAILGNTYPELFAAVGVHSGLAAGAASDLGSAMSAMQSGARPQVRPAEALPGLPTIVFHGDQDDTVHPSNGEQVIAASLAPSVDALGRAKLETEEHRGNHNGRDYTWRRYRDARGRVITEHWLVHGTGHAWSGGHLVGSYTDPKGPQATHEMLRFFLAHRKVKPAAMPD